MTDEKNNTNQPPQDDDATEPTPPPTPERSEGDDRHEAAGPEDTPEGSAAPGASVSESVPAASSPVPQAPPPPWHNRLMRRPEGKMIAGVCTGLAAYTGTDPVLWRIGFVVLTLAGGSGILAYLVAWLIMPEARPGTPMPDRQSPDAQRLGQWVAIAAVIVGALLIFRGVFDIHGGWFWGLLLIGIGVALWGRDLGRPQRPPPAHPPSRPTDTWSTSHTARVNPAAASSPSTPPPAAGGAPSTTETSRWTTPTAPLPPLPPPLPRREPSVLGRVVVGACALAIGLGLLLDNVNAFSVTPKGMFAVLLAIVGVGLLVGSWWGRARWLIFPGLALAFFLAVSAIIPFQSKGGWGDIAWQPTSLRVLEATCRESRPGGACYEHSAGQAILDLTDVDFGSKERKLDVRLGFGELVVVVPEDVDVSVAAHVQGGELSLFGGTQNDGWDISNFVTDTVKDGKGPLNLETDVTFGQITVRRGDRTDVENILGGRGNFDFRMGNRRFFRPNEGG